MARQTDPMECFARIISPDTTKVIISGPAAKSEPYKKIIAEPKAGLWQIACYSEKQVFHENVPSGDIASRLLELTEGHFRQVNGFSPEGEHIVLISKKNIWAYKFKKNLNPDAGNNGAAAPGEHDGIKAEEKGHNRKKKYILEEGQPIAPLVDMGVFTKEGKVVRSMYDKFRQINRFLEIIDDEVGRYVEEKNELNVIDFGCGKSYLTFVIYYYLTEIRHVNAHIIGLDLKADVIAKCNEAAERYGYGELKFEVGDVNGYRAPFDVDMVVTLHACDTATDYALYNAVMWNTKMIFSVPCCQHELNTQIKTDSLPILTRYGIVKERFSALATDSIRANMLEVCGYRTQLLEFIDMEGTPKNLLIRALRRRNENNVRAARVLNEREQQLLSEVQTLNSEFGFDQTLYRLLKE